MVDVTADLRDGHAEAVGRRDISDDVRALDAFKVVEVRFALAGLLYAHDERTVEVRGRGEFTVRLEQRRGLREAEERVDVGVAGERIPRVVGHEPRVDEEAHARDG